eukprot:6829313-Prymnesium_polylepis.6
MGGGQLGEGRGSCAETRIRSTPPPTLPRGAGSPAAADDGLRTDRVANLVSSGLCHAGHVETGLCHNPNAATHRHQPN